MWGVTCAPWLRAGGAAVAPGRVERSQHWRLVCWWPLQGRVRPAARWWARRLLKAADPAQRSGWVTGRRLRGRWRRAPAANPAGHPRRPGHDPSPPHRRPPMSAMPLRSTEDPTGNSVARTSSPLTHLTIGSCPRRQRNPGRRAQVPASKSPTGAATLKTDPTSRPPQPGAPSGNTRSTYASSATPATSPPSGAPDCNRPCHRLGPGGECGSCGELLTVDELLAGNLMP